MGIQGEFFERPAGVISLAHEDLAAPVLSIDTEDDDSTESSAVASTRPAPKSERRLMKDLSIPKLYYSISEVSRLTGIEPYVLRYWESEFHELRPQKNRAGNRTYSNRDIKFILRIKDLLREQRYTIEGAKHILHAERGVEAKEEAASTNDPAQIPLAPESKPEAPHAKLAMEEIQSMKSELSALKSLLLKH